MANYYLDIETTGLDHQHDKIITIQFARLNSWTGEPEEKLTILKEWELGEKGVLDEFVRLTPVFSEREFDFTPVGMNLSFEHRFLLARSELHGLPPLDVLLHPYIDLKPVFVLMNRGKFKGAGLDGMTGKPHDGGVVPEWYEAKEYARILKYINGEAREFVRILQFLQAELPALHEKFMNLSSFGPRRPAGADKGMGKRVGGRRAA